MKTLIKKYHKRHRPTEYPKTLVISIPPKSGSKPDLILNRKELFICQLTNEKWQINLAPFLKDFSASAR